MELDWLIFPSPDTSYSPEKINGELIFIPKIQDVIEKQLNNEVEINKNNDSNQEGKFQIYNYNLNKIIK